LSLPIYFKYRYSNKTTLSEDELKYLKNLQQETNDHLNYFVYLKDRQLPSLPRKLEAKFKYVSQGSILIEEVIATIRGLVEINQAEIDRKMQQLKEQEAKDKEKSDRKFQTVLAASGLIFKIK
jgi:hypothetical protein